MIMLGPSVIQPGDQLCVLSESQQLYVLRRPKGDYNQPVGGCFVQDLMWVRAFRRSMEVDKKLKRFTSVGLVSSG